jgi:hypothetical protein
MKFGPLVFATKISGLLVTGYTVHQIKFLIQRIKIFSCFFLRNLSFKQIQEILGAWIEQQTESKIT